MLVTFSDCLSSTKITESVIIISNRSPISEYCHQHCHQQQRSPKNLKVLFQIGAAACGSIAFLFALIAVSTEGWWSSSTVNHGLWTATVNNQKEQIFIGLDIGYRGLETVRGFNIISVLVLFSGLCTSIISFIPKFSSSSQAGIWIHAVSAIFISKSCFDNRRKNYVNL